MSFFRAVTGKGKIAVKPDKIRLYVNKEELCKEYEDTLRRSTEDTELLKDLFEKHGFQRKDLKTGFFYVLFSGSYLSAHTKQNLSIHSISENGRKPVKKISASATVLLTLKVEVQSPYNRITISYNRKGHRAFAVFLLSIFVGKCRRAVSDMRCRSPPLHLDFLHFKNSDGRYLW